jgi:hypothetical protein
MITSASSIAARMVPQALSLAFCLDWAAEAVNLAQVLHILPSKLKKVVSHPRRIGFACQERYKLFVEFLNPYRV